jgi:tRNA pseudouridine55 synthase
VTSRQVVSRLSRAWGETLGHAGTLDPDAVGVLVVAAGEARKLLQWLTFEPKSYWGLLQVGSATASLDAQGATVAASLPPWPSRADWLRASRFLAGRLLQAPPLVSARQSGGRRGYAAARAGEALWLPPRPAYVTSLRVDEVGDGLVSFEAVVGRGTYVRSLVRDWAEALGHVAHLVALVRTAVGRFELAESATLAEAERGEARWRSWADVWDHGRIHLDAFRARLVQHGQWPRDLSVEGSGPWALVGPDGQLVAVATGPGRFGRVVPARAGDDRNAGGSVDGED